MTILQERILTTNTKNCEKCGDEFADKTGNGKYCKKLETKECPICDKKYETECKLNSNQTCSKKCSGALIRRNQALHNQVKCVLCGDIFNGKISGANQCRQKKQKIALDAKKKLNISVWRV